MTAGARSCLTGKVCFGSQAEVDRWLAAHRRTKTRTEPRMRAYTCPTCGWLHVTRRATWKPESKHARRKGVSW